jgi:hypothetical protein
MDKLTALCNKCGWMGEVAPGLNSIPHDGCAYSACYSPTEVKLHDLLEAAKPIVEILDGVAKHSKTHAAAVMVDVELLRALRSAIKRAKGGVNG